MENIVLGGFAAGLSVFAAFQVRGAVLRLRPDTVFVKDLPAEAEGMRIAVLSDLHDRRFGKNGRRLSRIVKRSGADLILLAGDMHDSKRSAKPFYALLSDLTALAPVLYVDGNHDVSPRKGIICEEHLRNMRRCGVEVLHQKTYPVVRNGKTVLTVSGLSWHASPESVPQWDPSVPSILLCHDPMWFDRVDPLPDLMVAGHVHGGWIKLPFVGAVFAPGNGASLRKRFSRSYFFPKYSEGLYFKGRHVLSVSRGLGFSVLPIRFFRPEIPVLTLKCAKNEKNS